MPLSTWLIYFATVLVVSATPGPNMLLATTHGIRFGLRRTTPTLLGLLDFNYYTKRLLLAGVVALRIVRSSSGCVTQRIRCWLAGRFSGSRAASL